MRIHTTASLSEHMEKTPEGYLYCTAAALARTGVMSYLPEEVPEEARGTDGRDVLVQRDAGQVFRPETLASFEGKPLTLDHPGEDVSPENWSQLARGMVCNVRQGSGAAADLMLADILITDAEAIEAVLAGLRELSCGYDADFEVIRPGVGRQINIMGNHVALVDHGRAGARCKIKDERETPMTQKKTRPSIVDRLRRMLQDAEAEEAKAPRDEESPPPQDGETPVAATDDDMAASIEEIKLMLRTLVEALKPQGTDEAPDQAAQDEDAPQTDEEPEQDEDKPQADEEPPCKNADRRPDRAADAATVRSAQRMGLAGCRVGDNADVVRRAALGMACRDARSRNVVESVLGGGGIAKAGPAEVRAAFAAVSALTAAGNNRRAADSLTSPGAEKKSGPYTPADINKLNAAFYGKGGK